MPPYASACCSCNECETGKHKCFGCSGRGAAGEDVFKCSLPNCGRYFHPEEHEKSIKQQEWRGRTCKGALVGEPAVLEAAKYVCPRHVCNECLEPVPFEDLMACFFCPKALHRQCLLDNKKKKKKKKKGGKSHTNTLTPKSSSSCSLQ
jgi:hypothetical protein